jgi:hypothetical protein
MKKPRPASPKKPPAKKKGGQESGARRQGTKKAPRNPESRILTPDTRQAAAHQAMLDAMAAAGGRPPELPPPPGDGKPKYLDPHLWDGKAAISKADEVDWALAHCLVEVEPGDAPSARAWAFCDALRRFPDKLMVEAFRATAKQQDESTANDARWADATEDEITQLLAQFEEPQPTPRR